MVVAAQLVTNMAKAGRLLGALGVLMHGKRAGCEERLVDVSLLLGRLAVDDFENWIRFRGLLLRQLEAALGESALDPCRLLDHWVNGLRMTGIGVLPQLFLKRLREGLEKSSDKGVRSLGGAALALLGSQQDGRFLSLDEFDLSGSDVALLRKRLYESGHLQEALQLVQRQLQQGKGNPMWEHFWHAEILQGLGRHDEAFDAQYEFLKSAMNVEDPKHLQNGVRKTLSLLPFCSRRKARLMQIRTLLAIREQFWGDLDRCERLIDDVEAFHARGERSATAGVGRKFYRSDELVGLEEDLLREIRLKPSATAYYELAKIRALRGDLRAASEHIRKVVSLDACHFEGACTRG